MIDFSYNKEEDIIYVTRSGKIDFLDLLTLIKQIGDNFSSHDSIYIIDDLKPSNAIFTQKDYPEVVEEMRKQSNKFKEVRIANIVDDPRHTALSILYEKISTNKEDYSYKTFSTINAAKDWLKRDIK